MTCHLTDEEIQQFVLNKNLSNTAIQQHLDVCKNCKAAAANYALLFSVIEEAPKPLLEFDVVNMVMPVLPKPKLALEPKGYFVYALLIAAFAALCIPVYMYKKDLVRIFENMAPAVIALIALPVIAILLFQFYDTYKVYKKQMAAIK